VRILTAAVRSRGDVAPLTGLGTALRVAGHEVTVAAFGVFEELVTGCGLGFRLVLGDPQLLQASQQGQRWQEHGTGPARAIRFARLVARLMRDVNAASCKRRGRAPMCCCRRAWPGSAATG
jgi:sterol 3beta-glucosyltransferase